MKEEVYPCGYAPRALRRLPRPKDFEKVLFVGAKDGSVTVLCQKARDEKFRSFHLPCADEGGRRAAVRVLLEWGQESLLVGRDDGKLDLVRWREAIEAVQDERPYQIATSFRPPHTKRVPGSESVRYATWLDENQNQLLVSYRNAGTRLFSGDIEKALERATELSAPIGESRRLGGIRLAARIAKSQDFVLIDRKGSLWRWSPEPSGRVAAPKWVGAWNHQALPATFDDATYIGYETAPGVKDIRALILTTDVGVFALDLREERWKGQTPGPIRLALPGCRLFCMAVTYVQLGPNGSAHLWLTNRQGESFLFENDHPLEEKDDLRIRGRSGSRARGSFIPTRRL